jgi:hypothetical protein
MSSRASYRGAKNKAEDGALDVVRSSVTKLTYATKRLFEKSIDCG